MTGYLNFFIVCNFIEKFNLKIKQLLWHFDKLFELYFSFLLNLFCIKWFWFIFLFYHISYCMNISFEIVLRTLIAFCNRNHIYWRSTLVNLFQEKTKHLRLVIFLMFLMSMSVVEIHLIRVAHLFFFKVQLSQGQVIFPFLQDKK